ncbi:hypothetical protein ACH4E5_11085 [Streptomyces afghaniensis]|uniref:hypothetical protein n=1 Tax=Streptomyces afghaniensis TaxID=66865 RepID=UPI00379365D7
MTAEFLIRLDEGMLEYFRDMANEMVSRFGISRAEAVARINDRYQNVDISPYPDLMCHEFPEYWVYGLYYQPDETGRLPTGDEGCDESFDFSVLKVRPAPEPGSPVWTIKD